MLEKENNEETTGEVPQNESQNKAAQDLANDPILNASSINSEDYWFLKVSGNDK